MVNLSFPSFFSFERKQFELKTSISEEKKSAYSYHSLLPINRGLVSLLLVSKTKTSNSLIYLLSKSTSLRLKLRRCLAHVEAIALAAPDATAGLFPFLVYHFVILY
jgi:hypothetical protein